MLEGQPYFNSVDSPGIDEVSAKRLQWLGKESEVGVPILVEGEAWGEVYATTAPGQPRFRSEDVRFLETVAGQLAVAIGRAELFSRVSRLAYEDPLTGLANRRALEERLQRAVVARRRAPTPLAVLLCDVDELKAINDQSGHDAGDRALRRVAEALVAGAAERPGNLVGRLSGDEFCVVMEGATLEDARALAGAIFENLEQEDGGGLLLSCGAAALGRGVDDLAELMRAADAALYRAKRNGGGQIFTAGTRGPDVAPRHERRTMRRTTQERVREAVRELCARFGADLVDEAPLQRLEAVAVALSEALNTAAWSISFAPVGGETIHTVSTADDRDKRLEGLHLGLDNEVYSVAEYPATAALLEAGAGAFVARVDDQSADRAERTLLELLGRTSVLAAAAADNEVTWLLELYADDRTAPLDEAIVEAALLVRAAIPPRSARKGAALRERWARQVTLSNALGSRLADETSEQTMAEAAVGGGAMTRWAAQATALIRLRDDGQLEMMAGAGAFAVPELAQFTVPAERGLLGRCLRERRVVLAPRRHARARLHATRRQPRTSAPSSTCRCIVDGAPMGVPSVQSTSRAPSTRATPACCARPPTSSPPACAGDPARAPRPRPARHRRGAQGGPGRPRGRHRRGALRADAALRGRRAPARDRRGGAERPALRRDASRHRRARRARGDPQQARPAHRGGAPGHRAPPADRRGDPLAAGVPRGRRAARARRSRALGRHRLSGRPGRRGDPAGRAHPARLRHLRGDDHRPALPPGAGAPDEAKLELRRVAGSAAGPARRRRAARTCSTAGS